MKLDDVAEVRVHPAVGIARVGNSPDEYYVGPESPGQVPNDGRPYKDALGRVKRQAARFRLFGYDHDGRVVGEVTAADAQITWTVHVANKKGAWFDFQSRFVDWSERRLRNRWRQGEPDHFADPDTRTDLIIDPGPKSVGGADGTAAGLVGGTFVEVPVDLGELRTDAAGRLLVLGGFGRSATPPDLYQPIARYANNDYWFDDTCDGPVRASVVMPDGTIFEAVAGHVIVAPPKFAPAHENLVTLLDVVATASGVHPPRVPDEFTVEFHRDVLPLLRRVAAYDWVSGRAVVGHGPGMRADFGDETWLAALGDPAGDPAMRRAIVSRIRVPPEIDAARNKLQASLNFMPPLSGDGGDARDRNIPLPPDTAAADVVPAEQTWMTVTPWQYDLLSRWGDGRFVTGTPVVYRALEAIEVAEQPAALDRAALQACVGAPFFPGIEMTYIAADPATWAGPYRLAAAFGAGHVTRWMADPWQADFFECSFHWWPAARPDDVLPAAAVADWQDRPAEEDALRAVADLAERAPWARGLPTESPAGDNAMVDYWSDLGFVVPRRSEAGDVYFVEQERAAIVALNGRDLFHQLMNVDDFPEVLPKARAMADYWLAQSEAQSLDPATPPGLRFFRYSRDAFRNRLDNLYQAMVHDVETYDPATDTLFRSHGDLVERIRQFAPFNLTDGSWLRNIGKTGPMDEVRSLLYSIAMDEMGDGDVTRNHCNVYQQLCQTVGLTFAPIRSADFAYDPVLLDGAFTTPAFELAISQFSDDYFPELLGMTLNLEWGVVSSKSTRDLFERYGVDAHFYVMHIGIDNAVNGHGQRAAEAVQLYLAQIEQGGGGDAAVQGAWRRIWNGYVAFAVVGDFGAALQDLLHRDLREQVEELVARKAAYGRFNHDQHMLGDTRINAWFDDPEGFVQALIDHEYLKKGDWEGSRLCQLTSFESGPMYRVFTPEELALWASFTRSLSDPPSPSAVRAESLRPDPEPPVAYLGLRLNNLPIAASRAPASRIRGMGAVH